MLWIRFLTWFKGQWVGRDSYGNQYYRAKRPEGQKERRWVLYKGTPEASKVPAEWYNWLHHTQDDLPCHKRYPWEKNHLPNLTGTPYAYFPSEKERKENKSTGDYEAWKPHENKK